jgi:hypothetical protein
MKAPYLAALLVLSISAPLTAQPAPSLEAVLSQVRHNVEQSWSSLPDFVCTETVRSQAFENGKATKKTVIQSVFTAMRVDRANTFSMQESREVTAIDEKPVRKGASLPDAPLFPDGSTANLLFAAFILDAHEYKLAGTDSVRGRPALRIEFASRDNQKSLIIAFDQKPFLARDTGKAWIDPDSMQVVRLELRLLNMPGVEAFSTSTDYEALVLDDRQFWLPKTVFAESIGGKGRKSSYAANFTAEYTDCRKFEVTVKIR